MENIQASHHPKSIAPRNSWYFLSSLAIGLLFTLFPSFLLAQGVRREAAEATADRIIRPAISEKQLLGLVLAVVKNGQVVVKKGYGVRSFQSGKVPDENTVFYIASMSKALTAVGVMLLVEQGKVDLSAPASNYLKGLPKSWQLMTVGQFMAHQSGIPQLRGNLPTFAEMLRAADALPLSFTPGTQQEYNNFNFAVIGEIIQAVSGMSYPDYMKLNVFGPLHMNDTGFPVVSRNAATGYRPTPVGPRLIKRQFTGGPYWMPSHHLQSTLADLLKFYQALETGNFLKPATYEQMVTRVNPNLSATPGWFERKAGRDSIVSKRGAIPGFNSNMSLVSDKGDAVVILWTSQKQEGRRLFKQTNELLDQICNVGVRGQVDPNDEP